MRIGLGYDIHPFGKGRKLILGGIEIPHTQGLVGHSDADALVHDAVRPFLTREMIMSVLEQAAKHGAAVVGIPMRDTVKQVGADKLIECTVDRRSLWLAQTPQAFRLELLREAHRKAVQEGLYATDDAELVEHLGHRVALVDGSAENIKITRPEDLAIGEAILAARRRDDVKR